MHVIGTGTLIDVYVDTWEMADKEEGNGNRSSDNVHIFSSRLIKYPKYVNLLTIVSYFWYMKYTFSYSAALVDVSTVK
jgi:hypothetical protein